MSSPRPARPDPVELLEQQARARVSERDYKSLLDAIAAQRVTAIRDL